MVNSRAIEAFYYVARYGGITEAAKNMQPQVSPPTVSEHIAYLEE
jgi:DNA-binding transcriptional LysR family regulator